MTNKEVEHMSRFNIAEAKANISRLVDRALAGEDVVIARDNRPLVRLVPVNAPAGKRVPGTGAAQILEIAEDFDQTPDDFTGYR
jgi:prevent-host-death family protein